jgi:hypothetical protein
MANPVPLMAPRRSNVIAQIMPADRGEMLDAEQVRSDPEFFNGRVTKEYVLDHCAPDHKFYVGRAAVWYRGEVRAWWPIYLEYQRQLAKNRRRRKTNG